MNKLDVSHLPAELRARIEDLQVISRQRQTAIPPPTEEDRRREQARYLARVGLGKRYWYPIEAKIPADIRDGIREYAEDISARVHAGKGLLITGVPGCGKTHILSWLALAARGVCIASYAFAPDLLQALLSDSDEAGEKVRDWLRCDLLFLDDADRLYKHDYPVSAFDNFAERRHRKRGALVVTMNDAALLNDARLVTVRDRWRDTLVALDTKAPSQRGAGL